MQVFAASYDFYRPYEQGAETIGCSNPSTVRLSFETNADLTEFFSRQGIKNIRLSIGGESINIPAFKFVETDRTAISDKFPIFKEFDMKCSFVGQMHDFKFRGSLYKRHTTPSGQVLCDVSNPLEAIRFVFKASEEGLSLKLGCRYVNGDVLSLPDTNFGGANPYPTWYESFAYYGKSLAFRHHCGYEKMWESKKLLDLGYVEEGKLGLLDVVRSNNVYLWHRLEAVDFLTQRFPEEFSTLRRDTILGVFDDEAVSTSYKIEAALELAKIASREGFGYLKQVMTREDTKFSDKMYVASKLHENGDNDFVKTVLETMSIQAAISSKDKIYIIETLTKWGLIH